ncbi:MAG: Tm-1-like ATP-binding domain-containing protein [Halioglobus sp.]|nr:Tm-1-like ATP-binding domain-containing protein [Halioglobus sp.]
MLSPTILIVGTADTKADELLYLKKCVERVGGTGRIMDVGVLGTPAFEPNYSKFDVAIAAGTTNEEIIALGDENRAMTKQAEGASNLALTLQRKGEINGMLAIGGTLATDLSLDVALALPLGFPKCIASTVAFSPLLPPQRMAPDVMMVLWAGGLFGLNTICKSVLSQAAGAIVGACMAREVEQKSLPIVGVSSLGSSSLRYMLKLKPALEQRGFEVAVFHTTGMGGRALEVLAASGELAAVLDFSLVEVSNHENGSVVSAGEDRMEAAVLARLPLIVAPGGVSLMDFQTWSPPEQKINGRDILTHNRLIACVQLTVEEKVQAARTIAAKLDKATGPCAFIIPLHGIDEWDREGGPFNDPVGLSAFYDTLREGLHDNVELIEVETHINDDLFVETALEIFDDWLAQGLISREV